MVELLLLIVECHSLKDRLLEGNFYGNPTKDLAHMIAIEIVQLFKTSDTSYSSKQILVNDITCDWLKCRVCEALIEEMFDPGTIPKQKRSLLEKRLSFDKIIYCFFFMWPGLLKKKEIIPETPTKKRTSSTTTSSATKTFTISPKNVNKRNGKGETPLHVACNNRKLDRIEQLLSLGAEINTRDNAGWTPLHEACCFGNIDVVKELLKDNSIDLFYTRGENSGVVRGTTVLHDAVTSNQISIVRMLLEKGGNELLIKMNGKNEMACDLAQTKEMKDILKSYESKKNCSIHRSLLGQQSYEKFIKPHPEKVDEFLLIINHLLSSYLHIQRKDLFKDENIIREQYGLLQQHVTLMNEQNELSLRTQIHLKRIKLCLSLTS